MKQLILHRYCDRIEKVVNCEHIMMITDIAIAVISDCDHPVDSHLRVINAPYLRSLLKSLHLKSS